MEESKNTKTNVVGIGHNNTYSKEQYERLLNRFHYVMGFTKSAIYDIQRLFDDALTGYINSSGYSNDKLKPFQIYDRRQRAKRNVNVIISSLNKETEKAEAKAKANGLKLEVLEANKAAEEECARQNDAKGNQFMKLTDPLDAAFAARIHSFMRAKPVQINSKPKKLGLDFKPMKNVTPTKFNGCVDIEKLGNDK